MEYEIGDEDVLFDDSTNPSLKEKKRQSGHIQPPSPPRSGRKDQKAVRIPEEEDQAA